MPLKRTFTDAHGVEITFFEWPVAEPVGVIQIVHGLGEHARRYDHVAAALNRWGFAVYATDHRGHGNTAISMRAAGTMKKIGDLGPGGMKATIQNERDLYDLMVSEHRNLPVYLVAHSWGSMVGQRLIDTDSGRYRGVVFSGSTLLIPGVLPIAGFNKRWAKQPGAIGTEWLSRDRATQTGFDADPLNFRESLVPISVKVPNALQLLGAPKATVRKDLPLLLLAGSDDPIGGETGNLKLAAAYEKLGLTNVKLVVYHGARHEVYNETNRDQVLVDLVNWLKEQQPA